ncbi:MAG: IS110 family transposase [Chloroflexota bacterium]
METKVNQKLFEGQSIYVGIDCHKKNWTVTILGEEYEHKTMSQNPDPGVLSAYLKRNFPGADYQAVYEAGFNGFEPCRKLQAEGIGCFVAHAADVPTSHKEKIQKLDPVDSRKLARSLRSKEFKPIHIPDRCLEADRALIRQRFRMMKDLTRTKNRIRSILFQFGIQIPERFTAAQTRSWSRNYMKWLEELSVDQESLRQTITNYLRVGQVQREDLLIVNRQTRAMSQSEAYKHNFNLLISIPGIGIITAMMFLVQVGDIRRFKSLDDLCNYIGLVPSMHGSGEKITTGKMIHRGRKELKILLIEAAWEAVRLDPVMMATFNRLKVRMNKYKAIIRIARKMISRIRAVLLTQTPYRLGIN